MESVMTDAGWLWIIVDVVAVIILGAAIAYATMRWRRAKNRTLERVRDDATNRLYDKQ
jgi:hypothetical protein